MEHRAIKQMLKTSETTTLVKYNPPQIINYVEPPKPGFVLKADVKESPFVIRYIPKTTIEALCLQKKHEAEEILDYILPPKEWFDQHNRFWRQKVSSSPATGYELIRLENKLNRRLAESGAVEVGLSSARRALYTQCFDELIRQSTIKCIEQGLLLYCVRNEARTMMKTGKTLYQSSIAYALKKMLRHVSDKAILSKEMEQLKKEEEELENGIQELELYISNEKAFNDTEEEKLNRSHTQEIDKLRREHASLKERLPQSILQKSKLPDKAPQTNIDKFIKSLIQLQADNIKK